MTTFSNQSKSSVSTFTNQSESSTSYGSINQVKAGQGWLYNQANILYNSVLDPISGDVVLYNWIGFATVWTNQIES